VLGQVESRAFRGRDRAFPRIPSSGREASCGQNRLALARMCRFHQGLTVLLLFSFQGTHDSRASSRLAMGHVFQYPPKMAPSCNPGPACGFRAAKQIALPVAPAFVGEAKTPLVSALRTTLFPPALPAGNSPPSGVQECAPDGMHERARSMSERDTMREPEQGNRDPATSTSRCAGIGAKPTERLRDGVRTHAFEL